MPGDHLEHVRWLGGASGAGKSTIARQLAADFGLRVYSTDETIGVHAAEPGPDAPLLKQFRAMSMDERWLEREAPTMAASFPWFAGERFAHIVEDLAALPREPITLAEGFRLLPRLVQPLLAEPWHGIWLIPTAGFRRAAFARRPTDQQFWLRTSDPRTALERLLERDAMFAQAVGKEARELGLRVMQVDGTRSAGEVAGQVAKWFRLTALEG